MNKMGNKIKNMKVTFLGQGFEDTSSNAVGYHLIKYLNWQKFHSFTGISAFASEAGIFGLSEHIQNAKKYFKHLSLIVGIDQEGTSKEALEEILNLKIESYIFYQSEPIIFHPKIYLFEGENDIKLILGSSNLTRTGLFANVEGSILLEIDVDDKEGIELLLELKNYFKTLFDFSDPNLFKITQEVIADFFARGILPDEIKRREIYSRKQPIDISEFDNNYKLIVPNRKISKAPSNFPSKRKSAKQEANSSQINPLVELNSLPEKILVWESGTLTERDLNIPKGKNTNPTGSMLLKKGKTIGIDQRIYFRNQIFSRLAWAYDSSPRTAHIERATCFFRIVILGIDYGIFSLMLSHNTKTDTKTYRQKNSMTALSWGKAKNLIAQSSLIGKSLSLYSDLIQNNHFVLEIN